MTKTNEQIIAENYPPTTVETPIRCESCNKLTTVYYLNVNGDSKLCLACVHGALDHGRLHGLLEDDDDPKYDR